MFKFNFSCADGNEDSRLEEDASVEQQSLNSDNRLRPSVEIDDNNDDNEESRSGLEFEPFQVSKLVISKCVRLIKKSSDFENSDIIPGLYEGGYKVWECSIDLSEYLAKSHDCLAGQRIIELGCGQGIPGITAMYLGAEEVHFQDYDPEVLQDLTIPVVRENLRMLSLQSSPEGKVRYFSGDWGSFPAKLEEIGRMHGYDFVLTAETIYRLDCMTRILYCIKKALRKPGGICYLAAKSFYFGVGGGIAAFHKLVEQDGELQCLQVAVLDDGKSNKREILKLEYK